MPALTAALLVFLSSAAVLVLENLAARLLVPYVGVTLEDYTAIIGVVLAGIAFGSWWGGKLADRVDPRHLIGPFLVAGGILSYLTIPVVDGLGSGLRGASAPTTVVLTFLAFFAPAAALTAVTPATIKLQLASLDETGTVVGKLSAIGTAGAIIGTFLTGFVLVAAWPTRPVIRVLGVGLIALGIGVTVWLRGRRAVTVGTLIGILVAGAFSFFSTKVMTTGEGGAVVCTDADMKARIGFLASDALSGRDTPSPGVSRLSGGCSMAFGARRLVLSAVAETQPAQFADAGSSWTRTGRSRHTRTASGWASTRAATFPSSSSSPVT